MQPVDTRKTVPRFNPQSSFQDAQTAAGRAWGPNAVKLPCQAAHNVVLSMFASQSAAPRTPPPAREHPEDAPPPGLQLGVLFPRG